MVMGWQKLMGVRDHLVQDVDRGPARRSHEAQVRRGELAAG